MLFKDADKNLLNSFTLIGEGLAPITPYVYNKSYSRKLKWKLVTANVRFQLLNTRKSNQQEQHMT